jgi:hypothetical protein
MNSSGIKIRQEPHKFDDHFLDVVGNQFKFDHPKGLAEWLKNSADAYITRTIPDDEQFILLRFEVKQPKNKSVFECIDFVGCAKKDIDKDMKVWGSPTAANKGTSAATFGGHGNGGKFYMRQMFNEAMMITYANGLLNIFGFQNGKYGFDPKNSDRRMSLADALKYASIDGVKLPKTVLKRWKKNKKKAGFSVIRGIYPEKFRGTATIEKLLEGLRYHPQARRVLRHKQVFVMKQGDSWGKRLGPPELEPRNGFEETREIALPKSFEWDGEAVSTRSETQPKPKLLLRTSQSPLLGSRELSALNAIDVLGRVGCIGSYRMHELGFLKNASESEFIYGECECAFLENPELDSVSNDREKLIPNELTNGLLAWIAKQVDALAEEIAERKRKEQKSHDLAKSSIFNQLLDRWKNQFMQKLTSELFGGSEAGIGFDGFGMGDTGGSSPTLDDDESVAEGGSGQTGESGNQKRPPGDTHGQSGGKGNEHRKISKFPTVLLSGFNLDPLNPHATGPFIVDERQSPIYQTIQHKMNNIYWINTARPLARKILDKYGADDPRWREYIFQRYVDIILKLQLYELQRRVSDFSPEAVDDLIDNVTSRVHDAAVNDLDRFLFDERLSAMSTPLIIGNNPE